MWLCSRWSCNICETVALLPLKVRGGMNKILRPAVTDMTEANFSFNVRSWPYARLTLNTLILTLLPCQMYPNQTGEQGVKSRLRWLFVQTMQPVVAAHTLSHVMARNTSAQTGMRDSRKHSPSSSSRRMTTV